MCGKFRLKVSGRMVHCVHGKYGKMGVRLSVGGIVYCGLINTGAQISLVNMRVVRELESQGQVLSRSKMKVNIQGIGKGMIVAWERVRLRIKLGEYFEEGHNFVVLEEDQMPFCFLFGIYFLKIHAFVLDVGKGQMCKGKEVEQPDGKRP